MEDLGKKFLLLFFATSMAAFFQTFALKANIGVAACWDSISMNLYEICGLKVGTGSILLGSFCVLLQALILRRKFLLVRLLQVPVSILYGVIMNFFYYEVFNFELHGYGIRVLFCAISILGMAIFLGITTSLNLIPTPTEGLCYVISTKYHKDFGKLRLGVDILCVTISLILSFAFGVSLKVREGTIAGAIFLGPLMGWCMKKEEPLIARFQ